MKKIVAGLTIILISFSACKNTQTNDSKIKSIDQAENLKKNQKKGLVVEKTRRGSKRGDEKISEYFLRINEKDYFVKYDEGYISKEKLSKYINKEIVFKGELKRGPLSKEIPASITNPNPPIVRTGDYVAIYKIFN